MTDLTFGVEIEFIAPANTTKDAIASALDLANIPCLSMFYNHVTQSKWKVVTDGSLGSLTGFEVVSPPLPVNEESFNQIRTVCTTLRAMGGKITRQCGLHVHIGARGLTVATLKKLAALYVQNEQLIDQVMPPSRRANTNVYCRTHSGANMQALAHAGNVTDIATALTAMYSVDARRYVKLNYSAFWRHGTVEFRHHAGTLESDKIIQWIKFCQHLVLLAQKTADEPFVAASAAAPTALNGGVPRGTYWNHGRRTRTIYALLSRPEGATAEEVRVALGVRSRPNVRWHFERAGETPVVVGRRGRLEVFRMPGAAVAAPAAAPTPELPPVPANLDELCTKLELPDDAKGYWVHRAARLAALTAHAEGEV